MFLLQKVCCLSFWSDIIVFQKLKLSTTEHIKSATIQTHHPRQKRKKLVKLEKKIYCTELYLLQFYHSIYYKIYYNTVFFLKVLSSWQKKVFYTTIFHKFCDIPHTFNGQLIVHYENFGNSTFPEWTDNCPLEHKRALFAWFKPRLVEYKWSRTVFWYQNVLVWNS